jgi:hypothetical protein
MTADQFDNVINALCEQRPFQPFTILLVDGMKIEIDHPRALVNQNGQALMYLPGGKPMWFGSDTVSKIVREMASELTA